MEDKNNVSLFLSAPGPSLTCHSIQPVSKPNNNPIKKHRDPYVESAKDWKDMRNKEIPPFNKAVWLLVNRRTMVLAEMVAARETGEAFYYEWYISGQKDNLVVMVSKNTPDAYRPGFYWRDDIVVPKDLGSL